VTLDLAVLVVVLLAAVAGAVSGALRQVLKLAGVVAGWAAARWLAPRVVLQLQAPSAATRALVTVAAFLVAWLVAAVLARAILRAVQGEEEEPGGVDRLLGAVLGAAKGTLVAWVLLSLLALLGGRLVLGSFRLEGRGSWAAALAARHDLLSLASPGAARSAQRLVELWRDPVRRERLLRDPGWTRLLERSGLKETLDRSASGTGKAAEDAAGAARKQAEGLLADPELKALLDKLGMEPERPGSK
jgi:membrane protein required for colicin V production